MSDKTSYRDPRFMALEADPDYQEYLAEREKAGVPWLAGTELHDALYKQGWAARYEKLLVRHGIALGEIEFEPTTWPAPASIAEMEQRLTRLIDLDESATRIWRRAGYGDPPATEKHADDARCIARMVSGLGINTTAARARIKPAITRDEAIEIYRDLHDLLRQAIGVSSASAFVSVSKLAEDRKVYPSTVRKWCAANAGPGKCEKSEQGNDWKIPRALADSYKPRDKRKPIQKAPKKQTALWICGTCEKDRESVRKPTFCPSCAADRNFLPGRQVKRG